MKVLIVTALWPTAENPAFGSFVKAQVLQLQEAGLDVEVLVLEGRIRKLIYPRGMVQLRKRLADPSIDLVHAHYGYVGMVARTQWKVPVVVTFHGDDALGTVNKHGKKTKFSLVVAACGRVLAGMVDAVVVQSEQMARQFRHANTHIVPHEVDLKVFHPTDKQRARQMLGLSSDRKYILFAANPDIAVKRFPLAKEAVELLRAQDPSVELITLYKETQPRLALYMSACDALVFPSYQEGSPNVVKQAMACNLPIVATDVGDVREIIGTTRKCHICPPDATEFARKLAEVMRSPERTNGREHVQHLAGPIVARQLIGIYEETLGKRAKQFDVVTQGGG